MALSVTITVPSSADSGETIDISATVTGEDTITWKTTGGSIADTSAADTELTVPSEAGVIAVTCVATDADGATESDTAYVTVGDLTANIYTPAYQIEIQGVDVTDRWIKRDGMTVGKSLDYPELLNFRSSGVQFNLDNADGAFDYSNPDNFFLDNSLPAHGRGAQVLVSLGRSQSELAPVFAGEVSAVVTSLRNTKARIKVWDLSVVLRQKTIENFGIEITRRITEYEGANTDYDELNLVFYFPVWALPISRGSVSLTVEEDGSDVTINVVDVVATTGVLSNRNAEIDYSRGLIRFEAAPDDGKNTIIDATWKQDYVYKSPDFLIRSLLENVGINTRIGISDATDARFAIDQALVRHDTDRIFSTHGRPYFEREGITRWLKRDETNNKMYMAHDARLLEYDEGNDEYTPLSTMPIDSTLTENPPGGYGTALPDENIDLPSSFTTYSGGTFTSSYVGGVAITNDRIYVASRQYVTPNLRIVAFDYDGVEQTTEQITVENVAGNSTLEFLGGLDVYDGFAYVLAFRTSTGKVRVPQVRAYDLATGQEDSTKQISLSFGISNMRTRQYAPHGIAVTATRIHVVLHTSGIVSVFDHDGTRIDSEGTDLAELPYGMAVDSSYIYILGRQYITTYQHDWTAVTSRNIQYSDTVLPATGITAPLGLHVVANRLYMQRGRTIYAYSIASAISYGQLVPLQFEILDSDSFYMLATNTLKGDITRDPAFNRNLVSKYVKSTDTWSTLLDIDTGQPQLAHAYDFVEHLEYYGDNRKNFQVVEHSNEILIFYRRADVDNLEASIAMYNETDDTLTNIRSESYTVANADAPYSMDFVLDERSDGIYVYSFVVRYTSSSATLKIFRERVEPSGTETEIFSETFSRSGTVEYPISVSDIILAEDRSKFYFVLDYVSESTTEAGKSELCTVAKDGTGSRTVIKTYDNPLIGARSPVELDGKYYYLEGGWPRLPKSSTDDDVPDAEHYYPDAGGRLIEVLSGDTVEDHGVIARSASKLDSPDPDSAVYDGWGLHNAVVSNLVADDRDNLHCVAGFGRPYRVDNNLPLASQADPAPFSSNFVWVQWGQDLATKIPSFPTTDRRSWDLIQQLTQLMGWEVGFGPGMNKVDALQAANSTISDWGANASLFFRPRTILPAALRTAISASGTPTDIRMNDTGLPAAMQEFPDPPSGTAYTVVINQEMFSYTGVTEDSQGRRLTGISRAQNGSTVAAHSVDAGVYFVDYFASGERGTTLVSIESRAPDFVNLRNDINVGYGAAIYNTKNQESIDDNGEFTFNLQTSQRLLSNQNQAWAEIIGDIYLNELSTLKEVLQFTLVFSPKLQSGQLVVVYQLERVRIDFKLFRLVQVHHHTYPRWQTGVTALEII